MSHLKVNYQLKVKGFPLKNTYLTSLRSKWLLASLPYETKRLDFLRLTVRVDEETSSLLKNEDRIFFHSKDQDYLNRLGQLSEKLKEFRLTENNQQIQASISEIK